MSILAKLFGTKPKTLGEGLARVKKAFAAIGEDLSVSIGTRVYKTGSNNVVVMKADRTSLSVEKYLNPYQNVKDYIGKLASIEKNYSQRVKADATVKINRTEHRKTFAKKGISSVGGYPMSVYRLNQVKRFPWEWYDINGGLKQSLSANVKSSYKFKHKTIPLEKAISMGLKI